MRTSIIGQDDQESGAPSEQAREDTRPEVEARKGRRVSSAAAWIVRMAYMLVAAAAIFALCYLFGHTQLEGALYGNDIPWALSQAQWYARWFPDLPTWFPLQGGGTPLLYLYPPGTSLLVVLIQRLSGLTDIQAFRLLGFLSVPIAAIGIYALVWSKLKNQTLAMVAGLFYPLSSATWDWLSRVGLYAQSVSIMFVPWAFLLFDSYLSKQLESEKGARPPLLRTTFLPAALLLGLMFVAHIPTGIVFTMGISLYSLFLPLFQRRHQWRLKSMVLTLLRGWAGVAVALLLVSLWVVPFLRANSLANREGLSYIPAELVASFDFGKTLGITAPDPAYRMTFPVALVALALIGVVDGMLRREVPLLWGILAFGSVLFVAMPNLWLAFVVKFGFLWEATNDRVILLTIVLLPAAAAYGVGALARLAVSFGDAAFSMLTGKRRFSLGTARALRGIKLGTTALLSLMIAGAAVFPGQDLVPNRHGYGLQYWNGPVPIGLQEGRLTLLDPPKWTLSTEGIHTNEEEIQYFTEMLGFDKSTRLDVTANLGGITESLSLYSDASIINIYGFNASLIHGMWGYESKVCFGDSIGTPGELNELAKWFGLQYVVLHSQLDELEPYEQPSWEIVYPENPGDSHVAEVRRFKDAPDMATLQTTPVILVIGGFENAIYEQAFRQFMRGACGLEDGLIVEGSRNIDDYSAEELKRFDVVLLHGYQYEEQERAWAVLGQYIEEGGALYIDTGWQFFTPDWQLTEEESPAFLPARDLVWTDFGKTDEYVIVAPQIAGGIETGSFGPLIWEDSPWGVSAPYSDLRSWAQPVLSVRGNPIIAAGEYGEGRVVWSGMNLIGHAATYDNAAERELLRQLILWLAPHREEGELTAPEVIRDHPDRIRFVLDGSIPEGSSLLWREAYSPDWHASVMVEGKKVAVEIDRAGPGMMLLDLPAIETAGSVIEMDYRLGWAGPVGVSLSIGTMLLMLALVIRPDALSRLRIRVPRVRRRTTRRGGVLWLAPEAAEGGTGQTVSHPSELAQSPSEVPALPEPPDLPESPELSELPESKKLPEQQGPPVMSEPLEGAAPFGTHGNDGSWQLQDIVEWDSMAQDSCPPSLEDEEAEKMIRLWQRSREDASHPRGRDAPADNEARMPTSRGK